MISTGKLLLSAATVAPRPKVTRTMGMAQQIRVPLAANKVSQLKPVCFSTTSFLITAGFLYWNALSLHQAYTLEFTPSQALELQFVIWFDWVWTSWT